MNVLIKYRNVLNKASIIIALVLICVCCQTKTENNIEPIPPSPKPGYYKGVDLSFQPQIEAFQVSYLDENNEVVDLLPYLASKGVNLVRLRLWHTPKNEHSSLNEVLSYSQKIKEAGMDILLDFHYSDTWADPGQQFLPQAWENLTFNQIGDSIYQYTFDVLQKMKVQNTLPAIVQIGNETNSGFLWDDGKVGGDFDDNWPNYITLTKKAIQGVKNIDVDEKIELMIHFAGFSGASWYFENITFYEVDFDIIGLSYYSIWHGTDLEEVKNRIIGLSQQFSQKIMIVETGYPWTLEWNDWTNNLWGIDNQLIPGFPATPDGQKNMIDTLHTIIKNIEENRGLGFCYWAPDWVAYKGPQAEDGSAWENAAIFDFNNKVLPVISVFGHE